MTTESLTLAALDGRITASEANYLALMSGLDEPFDRDEQVPSATVRCQGKHGVSYARTVPASTADYSPRHAALALGFNATVRRLMGYGFTRSIASRMARRNATA